MEYALEKIDHRALHVSQVAIIVLNILAFLLNALWLVAVVTVFMLAGTGLGKPAFGFLYSYLLRPLRLVRPHFLLDNPQPHRFAQGLGGMVMLMGTLLLYYDVPLAGWTLVWLVAALAALNVFGGFCVGCFVYYWLARLRVPGFNRQPPPGTFPGMRSKGENVHGK